METHDEILRTLRRIEGEIRKLSQRITQLELWQSWLKGAWAMLAGAYAWLCKTMCSR